MPAGAADLGGIYHGRVLQIEVKAHTAQSPDQANWQRMIETQGGIYVLAHSVEEATSCLS